MPDLQTSSIALAKIKVRWTEPYASEGVNRQLSAIPRGIFRGGLILANSPADKTFKIAVDDGSGLFEDTCFIYADKANGFALAVLDQSDVSLDMSAEFSGVGGTIPGNVTWYVWADVDYSTGVPTSGAYHVTATVPPADAIVFGSIAMVATDTAITTARILQTPRTVPISTKRESGAYLPGDEFYGFLSGEEAWNIPSLDQKKAMNAAVTPPTASNPFVTKADSLDKYFGEPTVVDVAGLVAVDRFQLSGWFYVGKTSQVDALGFFHLANYSDKALPLYDAAGGYDSIFILGIYKSDDSAQLNPSTDPGVDAYGFYQNPWIRLAKTSGPFSYTGDLKVLTCRKKQFSALSQNPADAFPLAAFFNLLHSHDVFSQAYSGNPNSLSQGRLSSIVQSLLNFIDAKTIDPNTGTGWKLLWRSHNKGSDGAVDKRTISLYVGREPTGLLRTFYALCVGGYLSTSNFTKFVVGVQPSTPSIAVNCDVMMIYIETGAESALHIKTRMQAGAEIPAGSTWDWETGIEKDNTASDGDCDADAFHVSSATMTPTFSADDLSKKIKIGTDYKIIRVVDSATKVEYYGPAKTGTGYDVKVYGWTQEDKLSMGGMKFDWTTIELLRGSYLKGEKAGDDGNPRWLSLFMGASTSYALGVFGSIWYNGYGDMAIVRNAYWDRNDEEWKAVSNTYDAGAFMVTASGIKILNKSKDDSISSGWGDGIGSGKWTSGFVYMGETDPFEVIPPAYQAYSCAEVDGELFEILCWSLSVTNATSSNDTAGSWASTACSFRNRWKTAPSTLAIAFDGRSNWAIDPVCSLFSDSGFRKWGFRVTGHSDTLNSGISANVEGIVACY